MNNLHYYSENQEELTTDPKEFVLNFKENKFIFKTDNGVFSKKYLDFGSYTLINAFRPNDIDAPILDVGCGYGPIGIILSKIYNKQAYLIDINERAISLANSNIKQNKANAVAFKSNVFENVDKNMKFSSIISNPPIRAGKKVIYEIYRKAFEFLANNGELWIVIQKKQGAPSTIKELEGIFGNVTVVCKEKGYFILKSIKKHIDYLI